MGMYHACATVSLMAASCLATAASAQDNQREHRIAIEACIWGHVLANRDPEPAKLDDADYDIRYERHAVIGKAAAEACGPLIVNWAAESPAVLEVGEDPAEVAGRMAIHFAARGMLFADHRAEPFFWTAIQPQIETRSELVAPTAVLESPDDD